MWIDKILPFFFVSWDARFRGKYIVARICSYKIVYKIIFFSVYIIRWENSEISKYLFGGYQQHIFIYIEI